MTFAAPRRLPLLLIAFACAVVASPVAAQEHDHASCPMMPKHAASPAHDHGANVDRRGDEVMGFSHTATTHHFRLLADGGAIEVSANDSADTASLAAIRGHLTAVAAAFAKGDFAMPQAIHGEAPAGAAALAARAGDIEYLYEETESGARVRLLARTPETLAAVYDFLRYQITEHRTGDPLSPAR